MENRMFIQNKTGLSQIQHGNGKANRNRNFFGLLIIGLAFLLPTTVHAQTNGLKSGDRIKISLSAHTPSQRTMVGTVVGVTPSVLTLATKDSTYYITNRLIENLWVSEGKRRNTGRGALIGAISGGLLLGITTAVTNPDPCNEDSSLFCGIVPEFSDSEAFVIGATVGTMGGCAVGAIIGAVIRTERWERFPLNVSVDMQPTYKTQRFGINPTLSLRFSIGK